MVFLAAILWVSSAVSGATCIHFGLEQPYSLPERGLLQRDATDHPYHEVSEKCQQRFPWDVLIASKPTN